MVTCGCSDAVPDLLECCVAPVPKGFFNTLPGHPDGYLLHMEEFLILAKPLIPALEGIFIMLGDRFLLFS